MSKQVKLQPKHRQLAYSRKVVPELKISGVWLEEVGFKVGELVTITVSKEQLIIQPVKNKS